MKSSPLNTAPLKAPNTLPRATLRWSIAKPVTSESLSMSAMSDKRTGQSYSFVSCTKGSTSPMFGSRFMFGATPSIGAMRLTVRLTTGATFQPAVVKP